MIKLVNTGLAALIAATSIAAAATPAAAHEWGNNGGYGDNGYGGYSGYNGYNAYDGYGGAYGYDRERWEHHDHDNAAPLIAAGLVGLVLVAALASSHNHAQADNGYANSGYHPDVCTQQRKVWDPNADQYATRSYRVAC